MSVPHNHVVHCPYCIAEVGRRSCTLDDCLCPWEQKTEPPVPMDKPTCPECGEVFWADYGDHPLVLEGENRQSCQT